MGYTLVSEDLKPLVSEDWTQAQPLNGLSKTHDMGHYITKKKHSQEKRLFTHQVQFCTYGQYGHCCHPHGARYCCQSHRVQSHTARETQIHTGLW